MNKTILILIVALGALNGCSKGYYQATARSACNIALEGSAAKNQCRITAEEVINNMPKQEGK